MGKVYDSGFIIGRFHIPHKGHESLFDIGLQLCDRLLVFVGSAQESGTERNPFNIATRIKMLREIYDSPNVSIYGLADLTNENDVNTLWGNYVAENIDRYLYKMPDVMFYGDDRRHGPAWFENDVVKDTSEFIVPRGHIPVSATYLRILMVFDERKEWMKWVNPKIHKMYDELRAQLMAIPFYQEMYKKGKQAALIAAGIAA